MNWTGTTLGVRSLAKRTLSLPELGGGAQVKGAGLSPLSQSLSIVDKLWPRENGGDAEGGCSRPRNSPYTLWSPSWPFSIVPQEAC